MLHEGCSLFGIIRFGSGYAWDDGIDIADRDDQSGIFHRASRTLISTELIENFELDNLSSRGFRWLVRAVGVVSRHGGVPMDMRLSFLTHNSKLSMAIKNMLYWGQERVLLAHGKWFERDGVGELQRTFRWVLRRG
jgi:hypothetical protein